jgi:hypothetical protein
MVYKLVASPDETSDSNRSLDDKGTCPACTQPGIIEEIFSACNDSNMVYLNFHARI